MSADEAVWSRIFGRATNERFCLALRRSFIIDATLQQVREANGVVIDELYGIFYANAAAANTIYRDGAKTRESHEVLMSIVEAATVDYFDLKGDVSLPASDELALQERIEWHQAMRDRLATQLMRVSIEAARARLARCHDERDWLRAQPECPERQRRIEAVTLQIQQLSYVHMSRLTNGRMKRACWAIQKLRKHVGAQPLNEGRIDPDLLALWYGNTRQYVEKCASQMYGDLHKFTFRDAAWLAMYPEIDDRPYSAPAFLWF